MRARHYYVPAAWAALLDRKGWTNHQVALACTFSDEHVANILGGITASARRDTKMKTMRGLATLGATEAEVNALFEQR